MKQLGKSQVVVYKQNGTGEQQYKVCGGVRKALQVGRGSQEGNGGR